jgi:LuxR family quorum-sensing system transcriptional regulator CciR
MEPITRDMGFDCYALFQHVKHFSWRQKKLLAISNYPRSWLEYFFENKLSADDPIHLASYRTGVGFAFDQIPALIEITDRQRRIIEESKRAASPTASVSQAAHPGETNGTCTFAMRNGAELPTENLSMASLSEASPMRRRGNC